MPNLPNPFSDSGACHVPPTPDEAGASSPQMPSADAPADLSEPPSSTGGRQEASIPTSTVTVAAGGVDATDDIGEIFAGARKLFEPDPAAYTREDELLYDVLRAMDDPRTADLIEMPYGMEGIFDPPPLFIQQQMQA
jgi:hypothetical protein